MRALSMLVIALFVTLAVPARAESVTLRDIVELSRAGMGDEVLLALIELENRVFSLDAEQIKELKAAGVSEAVIVALLRSGRVPAHEVPADWQVPVQPPPAPVPPQVLVIEHRTEPPAPVYVPVPVFVPAKFVVSRVATVPHAPFPRGHFGRFINDGFVTSEPIRPAKTAPVYWGFGGKLRPGAWTPRGDKQQ